MNEFRPQLARMSWIESFVFILMFVLPFPIICLSPPDRSIRIQTLFMVGYLVLFIAHHKYITKIIKSSSILIILVYTLGAIIKFIVYGHLTYTSIVLPIVAFFGYYYIDDRQLKLGVFDFLIIGLYIFFILTYFRMLPSLFMRVGFQDGAWYGSSSSNAIPIILINVLYIYEVLAYLYEEDRRTVLLIFSIINFVLIIIQQSRAGILLSLLFVIWNVYQLGKNRKSLVIKLLPWGIAIAGVVWISHNTSLINEYIDVVGDISVSSYENDGRSRSAQAFFDNMTMSEFVVGYPLGSEFGETSYTYNTFLDHWNKYTIFGFVLTMCILIVRIIGYKKYYFPLYFLIPFFLYGWVEHRYLPNYWDFFIYLMLFKKCGSRKLIVAS